VADFGGNGPPTLLLHGVTSHWGAWLPLADLIAGERRLVALDLRGHGDSQWSSEAAYATHDLAADTIAVLDALTDAGRPIDLVGASWGGLCGLLVAGARPEVVRSLAVIDVPPAWTQAVDDVPPRPESFAGHGDVVAFERPRYRFASDSAIDRLAGIGTRPGPDGRLYFKFDPLFRARWGFRAEDHWEALGTVRVPTLIVRAGAGGALAPEIAQRMVAALPKGALVEIGDAGHSVHVDAPDQLADAVRHFWSESATS
jgi:pimeloyl-ACP methyl ester carboxylesterase